MTGEDFRATLKTEGFTPAGFARWLADLGDPRQPASIARRVRAWCRPAANVPGEVVAVVGVLRRLSAGLPVPLLPTTEPVPMPSTRRVPPGAVLVALSEHQWSLVEDAANVLAEEWAAEADLQPWPGHPLETFGRTASDRWQALAELRAEVDRTVLAYSEGSGEVYADTPRLRLAALVLSLYARDLTDLAGDALASITANQPNPARGERLHIPLLPAARIHQWIADAALAGAAVQALEVALRAAGDPLPPPTSPRDTAPAAAAPQPTAAGSAAVH